MKENKTNRNRPGAKLMRFTLNIFWAFFIAAIVSFLIIKVVGLTASLLIGSASFVAIYVLALKITIRNSLKKGDLKFVGSTKSGAPIFEIEDKIANAIALGFAKNFRYIIVSTGFTQLFSENQAEYESVMEHEDIHLRQMHNLTEILTGILLLVVFTSVVSITAQTPIILIVTYVTVTLMGVLFSQLLHRSFERLADKTSDPAALKSALAKIEEHNMQATNSTSKPRRFKLGIFSSHPPTEERPQKDNQLRDVSLAGIYLSFLVVIGLVARLLLSNTISSEFTALIISLILSVTLMGAAFIVIEYMFVSNLTIFLAKKLSVKSIYPTNILNGLVALLVLTAIPLITGINNITITGIFTITAIIISIIVTAIGTEPFKKGVIVSSISWITNSIIFITAALSLQIILLQLA